MELTGVMMKRCKALRITVPLLIAASAAAVPAFLPASPQAVGAPAKAGSSLTPAKLDLSLTSARAGSSLTPARAGSSLTPAKADAADMPAKTAAPAKPKPPKTVEKAKTLKKAKAQHKPAKSNKPGPAKQRKPQKAVKPANSGTPGGQFMICRNDSTAQVHGQNRMYVVFNNDFMGLPECLSGSTHAAAFRVAESHATATGPDSDAFPNIFTGCSWGRCSPGTTLPTRVSKLGNPVTTWQTTENAGGWWAASYDMWFDPQPLRTGQASAEMMIWLNAQGLYNPAGHGWPVVRIDGALWYVLTWITGNGHQQWRYVQFRKYTPRWDVTDLAMRPFLQYMENQGWITPSWYALNLEAGFEIWNGGAGLATTAFSVK